MHQYLQIEGYHINEQCGNHTEVWDDLQDEWCVAYEKFDVDMCWSIFASTMFRFWNGHTNFKRVPGLGVKMHWENQQKAIFHRKLIAQSSEAQEHEEIREALLELGQPSLDKLQAWKHRMQQPGDKSQKSKWIGDVCKWVRTPTRKPPPFIKANDGWTKTPQETVDVIRDFFASVYQHDDQMSWDVGNANHEVPADMWNVKHLNQILRNGKGISSPGLGGWTYAHFKKLPPRGVDFLHSLFMLCVICGRVPKHWLNAKLVVIPKGEAGFDLDAMRPITIEVTALRIFHKWLLKCGEITFDNLPENIIGGVPQRSGYQAWLHASLSAEKCQNETHLSFHGVAIDAVKFFDCIPHWLACHALSEWGMHQAAVGTWIHSIRHMRRFVSTSGIVARRPVLGTIGLPQGDPISMAAAGLVLAVWSRDLNSAVYNYVYVDDRLLFTEGDSNELQHAFGRTEAWDTLHNFRTQIKTCQIRDVKKSTPLCWRDGQVVKEVKSVDYLGVPLAIGLFSSKTWFEKKIHRAITALQLLARANQPAATTNMIVRTVIIPMLTYAGATLRPTKDQLRQLRTAIRTAAHGSKLGTFSARILFQKNYLLMDPEFFFVWRNLLFWNNHAFKRPAFKDAVIQSWEKALPSIKKIGPVSQLKKDLEYLQLHLNIDNLQVSNDEGRLLWTFGSSDCKVMSKALSLSFRNKIASELEQCNSTCWKGIGNHDFGTTTALLHLLPEGHPVQQKLIRVLINGINSFHVQFVKKFTDTLECRECRHHDATMAHLCWDALFGPICAVNGMKVGNPGYSGAPVRNTFLCSARTFPLGFRLNGVRFNDKRLTSLVNGKLVTAISVQLITIFSLIMLRCSLIVLIDSTLSRKIFICSAPPSTATLCLKGDNS